MLEPKNHDEFLSLAITQSISFQSPIYLTLKKVENMLRKIKSIIAEDFIQKCTIGELILAAIGVILLIWYVVDYYNVG